MRILNYYIIQNLKYASICKIKYDLCNELIEHIIIISFSILCILNN